MTASVCQHTHLGLSGVTERTKQKSCLSAQGMQSGKIPVSLYDAQTPAKATYIHTHKAQCLPYIALDVSEAALSSQSFPAAP